MENVAAIFSSLQATVGTFAGFGVDDSHSVASLLLVIALSMFASVSVSHLAERHDNVHLAVNVVVLFIGGVVGNAAFRGLQLPLGSELVITATLARFVMSAAARDLLVTYSKTDF